MPVKHFLVGVFCVLYVLSPVDLLPEALLGPFGLPDDVVAGLIAWRNFKKAFAAGGRGPRA